MRKFTLSALALAAVLSAGAVSAQSVNPGVAQLAAIAGVSPEGFTANQLQRLIQAQRDQDREEVAFILSQAGADVSRADTTGVASSDAQLAALAGVEPGVYSTNELQRLIDAERNNDSETVNFILSGENRKEAAPASAVTPGEQQLAATLGVDPADYTLSELTAMYADRLDG